jgi:hypothetical protein
MGSHLIENEIENEMENEIEIADGRKIGETRSVRVHE